jgi:beta-ureidopropionase
MAKPVRVSTIASATNGIEFGDNFSERVRDAMAEHLEMAAQAKPDIVAMTEFQNVLGVDFNKEQLADWAEPIPGPTTDRMAEIADRHSMYVVVPILEIDGGTLYNTAALIGRNGEIVGKYHKYQPTIGEMEWGVLPGDDAPAFDTDFGKVGMAICFDLKFVEVGQRLAANGARLVVFSSMFVGGERLMHWARDFGFYILSSCTRRSYVVDMAGTRFLAETGFQIDEVASGVVPPIASAVINMDREFFHLDYNQERLKECVQKYGPGVEWEICRPEAHFTLASNMAHRTIEDLIEEFELETWRAYLARARECRADTLARVKM